MKEYAAKMLVDPGIILGEGPCWDGWREVLWFVDIDGKKLFQVDEHGKNLRAYEMPSRIGTVAPTTGEELIVALEDGFWLFNPRTGQLKQKYKLNDDPALRFNDGKCDPAGNFWAGTMMIADREHPRGQLYVMRPGQAPRAVETGITISNGLAWTHDLSTLYFTDTPTRHVDAYDYDPHAASISNRRIAFHIAPGEGNPDGMNIDSEDMLWVAQWGGRQVARYNPRTGEKLAVVHVPAHCVSCPAFGGKNMDTLFITTANQAPEGVPAQSHPGALFAVKVGVKGIAAHRYQID